jgi:hypothetical protein
LRSDLATALGILQVHVGWRQLRISAASLVAGTGALAAVSLPTVTFISSNVGDDMIPGSAQSAAATIATHEFFGASTSPTRVQYVPGSFGQPGMVSVATPRGNLTLSWPSQEVTSGFFSAQALPTKGGPGISNAAAIADATAYAHDHFPWGLVNSFTIVSAGQPNAGSKDVEWRSRMDGVLTPMRLGITVEADGGISSFEAQE